MGVYDNPVPLSMTELMALLAEYPNKVSRDLLEKIPFSSLLDAGCGIDTRFAEWVYSKADRYIGVENGKTYGADGTEESTAEIMLRNLTHAFGSQTANVARVFDADLRELPPNIPRVDVAHMRFVLPYHGPADRAKILRNLRRVTNTIVLVERNFESMHSSDSHHRGDIGLYKSATINFMQALSANPFIGKYLRQEVEAAFGTFPTVAYATHQEQTGSYLQIIRGLCLAQHDAAAARDMKLHQKVFKDLLELFDRHISNGVEIPFTPPAIHSAVITF